RARARAQRRGAPQRRGVASGPDPFSGGGVMSAAGVRAFYESDADQRRLAGRLIAIIGYGSQGHAHALNLRDSGLRVTVGLRPGGGSWQRAAAEGLDVRPVGEAAASAD